MSKVDKMTKITAGIRANRATRPGPLPPVSPTPGALKGRVTAYISSAFKLSRYFLRAALNFFLNFFWGFELFFPDSGASGVLVCPRNIGFTPQFFFCWPYGGQDEQRAR